MPIGLLVDVTVFDGNERVAEGRAVGKAVVQDVVGEPCG